MEIEMPKTYQSQQDMDLIDILWRQDIDLGAGREVFDYSHRQKEYELEKQKKLEKERQEQLQKEEEKALLAQLQLDEETGEFVPRLAQHIKPEASPVPREASQHVVISEEDGAALSFDECMQLLAESFPLVEDIAVSPAALEPLVPDPTGSSPVLMAPHQPQQAQASLLTSPLPDHKSAQDIEQAWQELLSIPELQQCLNMPDLTELSSYTIPNKPPEIQNVNYNFYMSNPAEAMASAADPGCPGGFLSSFESTYTNVIPPENLNQMTINTSDLNTPFGSGSICEMFYPSHINTNINNIPPTNNVNTPLADLLSKPPLKPMDISGFTVPEGFESNPPQNIPELPDSDSGLSMDASPVASSPEGSVKSSIYGDAAFGNSDSDMEDMDSSPGSVQPEFAKMFPLSYHGDGYQASPSTAQTNQTFNLEPKTPKKELPTSPGHIKPPFTKDKSRRRLESRLSRDEQRAKALQIPFPIDNIINLPVDDFNEIMSKHQLNEAQLALIRDIRRRGKNKIAAQNCRKRKMENIVGLEYDLDSLKDEKEKQLKEKEENDRSLLQLKQQLNDLYLEVFSMLRDKDGKPYSPSEYSLQQTSDGSVFLIPKSKKSQLKKKVK
ncbi:nuclear factor erythroid 2-related factor 2-like [Polyodon spathula]|uniref:nuclear factor erythroid 2-related factor 2-like n=1 Tax=Polyodon spathula TaxID=7913 RepID=UPI001B7F1ED0|nr:nuclear factor erythroid 2-related factor 2-like [Polyodon spathula]